MWGKCLSAGLTVINGKETSVEIKWIILLIKISIFIGLRLNDGELKSWSYFTDFFHGGYQVNEI